MTILDLGESCCFIYISVADEIFGHLQAIVGHAQLRKAQGMQDGFSIEHVSNTQFVDGL